MHNMTTPPSATAGHTSFFDKLQNADGLDLRDKRGQRQQLAFIHSKTTTSGSGMSIGSTVVSIDFFGRYNATDKSHSCFVTKRTFFAPA